MAVAPEPPEPAAVPDRVAIETPSGDIHSGDVVDVFMTASASAIERWYVVEVEGHRFRQPASECTEPSL